MKPRHIIFVGLMVAAFLTAGCSRGGIRPLGTESLLEKHWGTSFESAKTQQILNPEAGRDTAPVEGLEGPAAEGVVEKYNQGFKDGEKTSTYNLNLGTISGIGQK